MKHIDLPHYQETDTLLQQLETGAFLTTMKDGRVNTMTIAWGGYNIIWNKPVFIIYVRYTRATYSFLIDNDEFTISVPKSGTLQKELTYCGTKSARDTDKIKDCNFTLVNGRIVQTPVIGECEQHYECKIIYQQAMEPSSIPSHIKNRYYSTNNYHVMFYGEIVDSYQLKGA